MSAEAAQPSPPAQPAARQPTEVIAQPVRQTSAATPRRVAQPGDVICSNCSEPNDPSRRFCRRCGTTLAAAVAPVTIPWYGRLLRRQPKAYEAGERTKTMKPGGSRSVRTTWMRLNYVVRWVLTGLVLVGVVGYIAIPTVQGVVNRGIRTATEEIRRFIAPTPLAVRPISAASSDETADHPAADAVDKTSNSWWQAAGPRPR